MRVADFTALSPIQRVWRGRRDAARARASWLAEWDARFGALRAPPLRLDAEARMLPHPPRRRLTRRPVALSSAASPSRSPASRPRIPT